MLSATKIPSILSMEVDLENEEESEYRILIDKQVKYLKIAPDTFQQDILSFPLASLPPLEPSDTTWTVAHISRNPESGKLDTFFSSQDLAAVQNVWHPIRINVLDLERTSQLTCRAFEAVLDTWLLSGNTLDTSSLPQQKTTVIAKIARFEWEIPRIEQETRAYQILQQEQRITNLAPRFLGQLHENGRVMGFILEKLDDQGSASLANLKDCEKALARFHHLGLLHGDVNRYNFLVGKNGDITLIDLENVQEHASVEMRAAEMQSLPDELTEESGRGGGYMSRDDED